MPRASAQGLVPRVSRVPRRYRSLSNVRGKSHGKSHAHTFISWMCNEFSNRDFIHAMKIESMYNAVTRTKKRGHASLLYTIEYTHRVRDPWHNRVVRVRLDRDKRVVAEVSRLELDRVRL